MTEYEEIREKIKSILREDALPLLKVKQLEPEVVTGTYGEWLNDVVDRILAIEIMEARLAVVETEGEPPALLNDGTPEALYECTQSAFKVALYGYTVCKKRMEKDG